MSPESTHAYESLKAKTFFKLVCGASFHDLEMVERLSFIFTLANADCIDLASRAEVILSAQKGIQKALEYNSNSKSPLIMASLNLDEDPHFRKIVVDHNLCDLCSVCIKICPTQAFSIKKDDTNLSYMSERCYGCGDCPSICHVDALSFVDSPPKPKETLSDLIKLGVKSVEFHFGDNYLILKNLWSEIGSLVKGFDLISFSIGGKSMSFSDIKSAAKLCYELAGSEIIIQSDGQSMSGGSIKGKNKDELAIDIAKEIQSLNLPVYVQLSGGTNEETSSKVRNKKIHVNGIAIGSYARKKLLPFLEKEDFYNSQFDIAKSTHIAQEIVDSVKPLKVS